MAKLYVYGLEHSGQNKICYNGSIICLLDSCVAYTVKHTTLDDTNFMKEAVLTTYLKSCCNEFG